MMKERDVMLKDFDSKISFNQEIYINSLVMKMVKQN